MFFVAVIILSACSSARKITGGDSALRKDNLQNLYISGKISSARTNNMTANFKMKLASVDSVRLNIMMPFGGVEIGRLFCTPKEFVFVNMMEGSLFKGEPKSDNLKLVLDMPLSYAELIRFIRCESPGKYQEYTKEKKTPKGGGVLFRNEANPEFVEFIIMNDDKTIKSYQRRSLEGVTLVHVDYSEYENVGGFKLAKKFVFKFPHSEERVLMEINEYKVNIDFEKPFSFKTPKGLKEYRL